MEVCGKGGGGVEAEGVGGPMGWQEDVMGVVVGLRVGVSPSGICFREERGWAVFEGVAEGDVCGGVGGEVVCCPRRRGTCGRDSRLGAKEEGVSKRSDAGKVIDSEREKENLLGVDFRGVSNRKL